MGRVCPLANQTELNLNAMNYYYFVYQDVGDEYETSGVVGAADKDAARKLLWKAKDKERITLIHLDGAAFAGEVVVNKLTYWPQNK